uniref:FHOD1/3-like FH3 domain-containing protein n=1 Tax=Oncorhynchus kisutch TaxID=8019 RepID=A0A8C7HA14_ONCKI
MLYVDGMNGVICHIETVQWLYALIGSKFRLVVKTALKLLLVFVEYSESNASLLIEAVTTVDTKRGCKQWSNAMEILDEKDGVDTELLVYGMTLINKVHVLVWRHIAYDIVYHSTHKFTPPSSSPPSSSLLLLSSPPHSFPLPPSPPLLLPPLPSLLLPPPPLPPPPFSSPLLPPPSPPPPSFSPLSPLLLPSSSPLLPSFSPLSHSIPLPPLSLHLPSSS